VEVTLPAPVRASVVALMTAALGIVSLQPSFGGVTRQTAAERWLTNSEGCYHDVVPSVTNAEESLRVPESLLGSESSITRIGGVGTHRLRVVHNREQEIAAGKVTYGRYRVDYVVSRRIEDPASIGLTIADTRKDLTQISTTHGLHIGSTRNELVGVMGPSTPAAAGCDSWLYAYEFKRGATCEVISFVIRNPGRAKALYTIEAIKFSSFRCDATGSKENFLPQRER